MKRFTARFTSRRSSLDSQGGDDDGGGNPNSLDLQITDSQLSMASRIASGSFGDVLILKHPQLGQIALRQVRLGGGGSPASDKRRRIRRAVATWQTLKHPHVLSALGVFDTSNEIYIILPSAHNGSLRHFIALQPNTDRLQLLAEATAGIAFLHRRQIIHGNIRASNILVSRDVHALVSDFDQIQFGPTSGARWVPPEAFDDDYKADFPGDVWAYGMLIYEVLSGRLPFFENNTNVAIFHAILNGRLPPKDPSRGPNGNPYNDVWAIAASCWKKDPSKRISMQIAQSLLPIRVVESLPDISQRLEGQTFDYSLARDDGRIQIYVTGPTSFGRLLLQRIHASGSLSNLSEERRQFRRQGEVWKKLKHQNVLQCLGFYESEKLDLCLVMPLPENGLLNAYLLANPLADRVQMLTDAAAGCAYLHDQDVIHGDIRVANAVVSDAGRVLVFGFEVSITLEGIDSDGVSSAQSNRWTSPEALTTEVKTKASDVWAFGMFIYEVLSGQVPFSDVRTEYEVMRTVTTTERLPPTEPATSPDGQSYAKAWAVAALCWRRKAEQRISMAQVHAMLQRRDENQVILHPNAGGQLFGRLWTATR